MELEGGFSASRPVEENDGSLDKTINFDEIDIKNNGSCAGESGDFRFGEHGEVKTSEGINGKEDGIEKPVETPSKLAEFPAASPSPTKGFGLKKWRRIRRDFSKDGATGVDFSKILKRGLPNTVEPTKHRDLSSETKQMSESSVASADSLVRSPGVPSGFVIKGSSSDSRLALGSGFPVVADSENSEDRSSKSSTAGSAPKLRYVNPIVMASTRGKSKVKNHSGKSLANAVQKPQLGKGKIETSKKLRGERVKTEKDSSYSSVESDLRSFSIAFAEIGSFSGTSNGRQRENSSNHEGENTHEAHVSDQQSSEEIQTVPCKDNGGGVEDASQDDEAADVSLEAREEEIANLQSSTGRDPLVESIISLQAVREALEKEIQKFGDIGKEPILNPDGSTHNLSLTAEFGSVDSENYEHEHGSFDQLHFEAMVKSGSLPPEVELIKVNQKVSYLERKMEEALTMLEVKESRVVELEGILNKSELPKEGSGSCLHSHPENFREVETELEDIFKQKIEADVEYLVIARTTQKLKVATEDQIALFEEQKSLAEEQNKILHKIRKAESSIIVLKKEGEELESSCEELLVTEEVLKMHNRVCTYSLCFFVQLILLCLALWLFILHLPLSTGFVPT